MAEQIARAHNEQALSSKFGNLVCKFSVAFDIIRAFFCTVRERVGYSQKSVINNGLYSEYELESMCNLGTLAKINGLTARIYMYNALSLTTEVTYKIAIQD